MAKSVAQNPSTSERRLDRDDGGGGIPSPHSRHNRDRERKYLCVGANKHNLTILFGVQAECGVIVFVSKCGRSLAAVRTRDYEASLQHRDELNACSVCDTIAPRFTNILARAKEYRICKFSRFYICNIDASFVKCKTHKGCTVS